MVLFQIYDATVIIINTSRFYNDTPFIHTNCLKLKPCCGISNELLINPSMNYNIIITKFNKSTWHLSCRVVKAMTFDLIISVSIFVSRALRPG